MAPDTIIRLLETSARYFGLDVAASDARDVDDEVDVDVDTEGEGAPPSVRLACLMRDGGCMRPRAMA